MSDERLVRRYAEDAGTFDEQLALFGIRTVGVRHRIAERVRARPPGRVEAGRRPRDPLFADWRPSARSATADHGWYEPPHALLGATVGRVRRRGLLRVRAGTRCPRLADSHKVTRTRLTFFDDTDQHDRTISGFGRTASGWMPLPRSWGD